MTSRLLLRGSLVTLVALGALASGRTAAAAPTSCSEDSDCTKGFTCQVVGASGCPAYACPAQTGAPDVQTCPPPPACNPQVVKGCLPGPCSTDSDCATGMVCHGDSYTNCPVLAPPPSCPPNADCAAPAADAGACTTTTVNSCVPRYDLPCTVDSDCGDGFTCVPDTVTSCAGGGSAGSGGAVGAPATGTAIVVDAGIVVTGPDDASPPPPTCTTTTGSTSSCRANAIACAASSDCPATWTCVAQPQPASVVCAGPASFDGSIPACGPFDAGPAQSLCQPPYADLGSPQAAGSTSGSSGAPVPAAAENGTAEGGTAGSSGGCQVAAPGAPAGEVSLLVLLGLTALSRRRRSN